MVSHKKLGGLEITLGAGGLRFKKRKSRYNVCIAGEMAGVKHTKLPKGAGGRYDKKFQDSFRAAVAKCK